MINEVFKMNEKKIKEIYLKQKLYWSRANGHLSIPLSIFEKITLVFILAKLFNYQNYFLLITISILFIIFMLLIGYFDVKTKFFEAEQTLTNKHNKEMQILLKK
jgi:hypothetical protein